ncbi:MAG: hypothetical protein A2252_11770 [Elusimicrobia bacterium RIFOXYA2_FULL_39_19]|nr:MAG: hypothetical protein A2252_11770 [Elusimicrobia bacterium RIFOXYA2_FULL_39_19]
MFKRAIIVILSVLVAGVLFVSCGNKNALKTENEVVTLRFVIGGADLNYNKLVEEVCRNFESKNPNIKIRFEPVSGQAYGQKLLTMFASNTAPDVFSLEAQNLPSFIKRNAIVPLDSFIEKDKSLDVNMYYPAILEEFTWGGKIYSFTDSMSPSVVYYNKDLFDKAKIKYPSGNWTWNEFLEVAKKMTIKDERGIVKQFGAALYDNDVLYFVKAWGGSLWNKDKSKCVYDTPESRAGLQFLIDMILKYHVIPDLKDSSDQGSYEIFEGGRAGMFVGGRWYTVSFRKAKVNFGVCELPKGKIRISPISTHAWVISSQCKFPQQSYEFIKYFCSEEVVKYMMAQGDCVPPIKKLAEMEFLKKDPNFPNEDNTAYIKTMAYAYPFKEYLHPDISWSEVDQIVWAKNIDGVLLKKYDIATYTKMVQDQLNKLIGEKKTQK